MSLADMSCALADCKCKIFPEASGLPPMNYFISVVSREVNHGQLLPAIPESPDFLRAISSCVLCSASLSVSLAEI